MKVTKKWTKKDKQKGPWILSASVGQERYDFIHSEGINVSVLIRDAIDQVMKDKSNGVDIFKRLKGTDCYA